MAVYTNHPTHPHRIDPPLDTSRRTSRNALRIEAVEPQARCNLRPRDAAARWIVAHRPFHLTEHWVAFDYCISDEGCRTCRVFAQAPADDKKELP